MQEQKNKIHRGGKAVELAEKPISLRTTGFVEGTVENQHHTIAHANGIEAAVGKLRKTGEVVCQRGVLVPHEVVISERRVDGNTMIAPGFRFGVIHCPVFGIFAGVDDISTHRDESGMLPINGSDQGLAYGGVGGLRVRGVVEASVSKNDKTKVGWNL